MHRKPLIKLLETHKAHDENELRMTLETIRFVKENEDCFKRELLIGHVTASAWIIDETEKFTLIIHHAKLNRWFQPGGHCDGDNDVLRVALKEAQEETGIADFQIVSEKILDIDIHEIPKRKGIPAHLHYDVRFLLKTNRSIPLIINEESNDLAWVSLHEIEKFTTEESVLRMVRKSFLL